MKPLLSIALLTCLSMGKLPKNNQVVMNYVKSVMGTKVGTGECADLIFNAQFKVKQAGLISKTKTKKILVGDYVSFKDVVFKNNNGSEINFTDHQAIVFQVKDQSHLVIAHQNHNDVRRVDTLSLDLTTKASGGYKFRHP